jgi:hypothetical protein
MNNHNSVNTLTNKNIGHVCNIHYETFLTLINNGSRRNNNGTADSLLNGQQTHYLLHE